MKRIKWLAMALMIVSMAMLTVSCATQATQTEPSQDAASASVDAKADSVEARQASQTPQAAADAGASATSLLLEEQIYFDFDSALLTGPATQRLIGKADYLRQHGDVAITVEGHCDARGTEAYNMALGQRRAEAVKRFLLDLGIRSERVETISYGEERPAVSGNDESAWAQNRRAEFLID